MCEREEGRMSVRFRSAKISQPPWCLPCTQPTPPTKGKDARPRIHLPHLEGGGHVEVAGHEDAVEVVVRVEGRHIVLRRPRLHARLERVKHLAMRQAREARGRRADRRGAQ